MITTKQYKEDMTAVLEILGKMNVNQDSIADIRRTYNNLKQNIAKIPDDPDPVPQEKDTTVHYPADPDTDDLE